MTGRRPVSVQQHEGRFTRMWKRIMSVCGDKTVTVSTAEGDFGNQPVLSCLCAATRGRRRSRSGVRMHIQRAKFRRDTIAGRRAAERAAPRYRGSSRPRSSSRSTCAVARLNGRCGGLHCWLLSRVLKRNKCALNMRSYAMLRLA